MELPCMLCWSPDDTYSISFASKTEVIYHGIFTLSTILKIFVSDFPAYQLSRCYTFPFSPVLFFHINSYRFVATCPWFSPLLTLVYIYDTRVRQDSSCTLSLYKMGWCWMWIFPLINFAHLSVVNASPVNSRYQTKVHKAQTRSPGWYAPELAWV